MLKRIVILILIISSVTLVALTPLNVNAASDNAPRPQETIVVTVAVVTAQPESTAASIPVTGSGLPISTMIIFSLLAILGVAVFVGGLALLSRRQQ